jgi:hypothetical protein
MSYEEERLRILERVSKGELTPEEGQLQIAMMKVKAQRQEPELYAPPEPPPYEPPSVAPLVGLLALPILLLGGFFITAMTVMLAFPVYLAVWLWNAQIVPAFPHAVPLAYFPTLGLVVLLTLLSSALRFRHRLRVSFKGARRGEQ